MSRSYLAFDLGAESGRAMLGTIDSGRLVLEELHRFPNTPVRLPTGLYWDPLRLYTEIETGLSAAGKRGGVNGIGVDTWGVDFALLGADGALVDVPRHYRDARNNGMLERTFEIVSRREIFEQTGLQFMQLNTLYQLYAMKLSGSPALAAARRLLFMPDLFAYWLSGVQKAELTIASTSQFYNPLQRQWALDLLDRLGLPAAILPEIAAPGTKLGMLRAEVARDTAMSQAPVFATASHDTAAAVASVPAEGDGWCYISSGTWSLMGVELDSPIIDDRSLGMNFTNEVGFAGSIRFLKNIAGMWPIQECRRAWAAAGQDYSYQQLTEMAAAAEPFLATVDPDAFLEPGNMPGKIADYCRLTAQKVPETPGQVCRVIFESLALRYRQVLEHLESILGGRLSVIHIVGGGSQNRLLNQFVADSTGRRAVAGPVEATAAGNVLVQAIGDGAVDSLAEARAIVRNSFKLETIEPVTQAGWDHAYDRFRSIARPAAV